MSHEPTRLMACERARGGQCIRVAVHRGSPRERRTENEKKIFSFLCESRLAPLLYPVPFPPLAESTVRVEKAEAETQQGTRPAQFGRFEAPHSLLARGRAGAPSHRPHGAAPHSPGGCPWTGSHAAPSSFEKSGPNFPG